MKEGYIKKSMKSSRTFEEIKKYNHYHGADGRFTTSAKAVHRDYHSSDPTDVLAEQRTVFKNSMSGHITADGKIDPKREELHKRIIRQYLKGLKPTTGQGVYRMMGGGPASGKGRVIKDGFVSKMDPATSVRIDPDVIKEMLPGFKAMSKKTDRAAAFYHEESSMIAKRLLKVAADEHYNITYDGTGDGSVESVMAKLKVAKEHGYRTEAEYVTVNTDEASKRNVSRYLSAMKKGESPRLVPDDFLRECHPKVTSIGVQVAHLFDKAELYDNNGPIGSKPVLIAAGGKGKGFTPVPGQEKKFEEFLNKAN